MKSTKKTSYELLAKRGYVVATYDSRERAERAAREANSKCPSEAPHEVREA